MRQTSLSSTPHVRWPYFDKDIDWNAFTRFVVMAKERRRLGHPRPRLRTIARMTGIPLAPPGALDHPEPRAYRAFRRETLLDGLFFPFSLRRTHVKVALADPSLQSGTLFIADDCIFHHHRPMAWYLASPSDIRRAIRQFIS